MLNDACGVNLMLLLLWRNRIILLLFDLRGCTSFDLKETGNPNKGPIPNSHGVLVSGLDDGIMLKAYLKDTHSSTSSRISLTYIPYIPYFPHISRISLFR